MNYADLFHKILDNTNFEKINISENEGVSGVTSVVLSSNQTPYRKKVENVLIARIKKNGKKPYVSFKSKYNYWFMQNNIETYSVKSDNGFIRIGLNDFLNWIVCNDSFKALLYKICLDAMNFDTFGCCGKFEECSNVKKCLHEDQLYSTACLYRKNLENNKIFYGYSKNT